MRNDRRRPQAYKLRVYMDAIKDAKAMTNAQWVDNLIASGQDYMPLQTWIAYLERCALAETAKLLSQFDKAS